VTPAPRQRVDPDAAVTAALRLAAAGRPVFPCVPHAKRPLTRHGLLDATTDPDRIRTWWRRWPTANLAVRTGAGSVDVLDVDVRPGGSGYPAYNRLKRAGLLVGYTAAVATPSSGLHLYFPGTAQPSSRLPDHHLDLKAAGGYVLVPPSVVDGRPYTLVRQTERPGADPLDWAACRALEQGLDAAPLVHAAVRAGLPEREAARTVASAARRLDPAPAVRTVTAGSVARGSSAKAPPRRGSRGRP